ncbi:hypothetical protein M513_11934 [Trichuris suis]|uniref:Uncharacterized protein n=1 Tax=Trichuris suis TaxID=68888 RepID=A0A085LQI1_9BILA|nr:hypothetical protein M513_11934 [Trichuris suis]
MILYPNPTNMNVEKYYKAEDTELGPTTTTDRRQKTRIVPQRTEDRRFESYRTDTIKPTLPPTVTFNQVHLPTTNKPRTGLSL